jgi:hypothetical protein
MRHVELEITHNDLACAWNQSLLTFSGQECAAGVCPFMQIPNGTPDCFLSS